MMASTLVKYIIENIHMLSILYIQAPSLTVSEHTFLNALTPLDSSMEVKN